MLDFKIRPAVSTDLPALMAIDHSSQSDFVWQMDRQAEDLQTAVCFREIWLPRPVMISYPRSAASLPETWSRRVGTLVAQISASPVGYVRINDFFLPQVAFLTDVVVTPRHRRQGLGSALVEAAIAWALNRKNKKMIMEMISKNAPAICLARSMGFDFCGYNEFYYETKDVALFFGRCIA